MSIDRRLKVRAVLPHDVLGGAERWFLALAAELGDRWDLDAVVLTRRGAVARALDAAGIPCRELPTGRHGWDVAMSAARLSRDLRSDRPDLLLCNGVKAAAVGVPAARLAGVRALWCKHDFALDEKLGRLLVRYSDAVVATSAELLTPVGADSGVVLPPALPAPPLERGAAEEFWRARGLETTSGPVLAMLCRISHPKSIDIAIRSLVLPGAEGWRLAVIGPADPTEPELPAALRALAQELGVQDRVHFTGEVPDAGRLLAPFAALAVLTVDRPVTQVTVEGFGVVVLESYVAGVPVISTPRVPATALGPQATVVVRPESPEDVAGALQKVIGMRAHAEGVSRQLRAEHPDIAAAAEQLLAVAAATARRPGAGTSAGPPVSVVTTVLNEERDLPQLLTDVTSQLRPDDELVVVDAGSVDATQSIVRQEGERARVRLIVSPGASISAGRNEGVQAAEHDVIAFTDAGCRVQPGWLDALRAGFGDASGPDLLTGVYRVSARTPWEKAFVATSYPWPEEALHPTPLVRVYGRLFGRVFDPVLCTGRSMAISRRAFTEVGGFSTTLATAEDVMLGRSVAAKGGRCLLSVDAEVVWAQRSSVRSTARMYFGYGRGGGHSGDPLLVTRDLLRVAAYGVLVLALVKRSSGLRAAVVGGAAVQLSLPVARILRTHPSPRVLALLPATLAVKDLSKAAGCLVGLAEARSTRSRLTS